MTPLRERVEAEFENIERVLAEMPAGAALFRLTLLELAGVATLLHNFYNGIENILKCVVRERTGGIPAGESWHRDLVNMAASRKIIGRLLADDLKQYLAFRHFFVHAYALDLQPERLEPLTRRAWDIFASFRRDIESAVPPSAF